MYYCENLTWKINDIKDNLQIDKAFDIGQLLTHVFWSEQVTECYPSMCSSTSSETSVKEISFKIQINSEISVSFEEFHEKVFSVLQEISGMRI